MFKLSRTFDVKKETMVARRRKGLEDEVFDASLMYIEDMIRYSTNHAFK